MSEIFERWKNAGCVFNGDFYSVTTLKFIQTN
ncbi:conserved hypothetical protein [Photorhabdus asymbiotica]|uniref:Uncharacterized protein n=1 Tax=Photorhabdus asymbiotica subsp. asymbiotica (strain ATCC 43949 / 3105-77) TaxID=553480 RepID=B6VKT2_PHOAA|nr:conserved hypothetical protein [Photorhabdus asymbiotica]CAR66762.1 conserved hypothetical protein [Photorhabdus asymbiotica subsp. asymbiotica ATCC 43949]